MSSVQVAAYTLTRSRLSEEISRIIQKQIMSGDISAGAKLPAERELADSFKVNRTTMREALRRLEGMELVDIRHGDGVYAKNYLESSNFNLINAIFDMDEGNESILYVLEVRRIVVPEMAYLAAQRCTDAELEELEQIISNKDMDMLEQDTKVNQVIARATRNPVYTIMQNFFYQVTREYSYLYFDHEEAVKRAGRFYRRIFNAIKRRNAAAARRIMREAMIHSEERLKNYLSEKHKI
jgi:GntR family transcriptional regulator, transcriptional repressor for pyruvate dehydrogenase complex